MKPEAQLIALLEWIGWEDIEFHQPITEFPEVPDPPFWRGHPPRVKLWHQLPMLTLDLMHESEKKLNPSADLGESPVWDQYIHNLHRCGGDTHGFHSTKEQRLEALLKTIGKWRE